MKSKIWKFLSYVLVAVAASVLTLAISALLPGNTKLEQLQFYLTHFHVENPDAEKLQDAAASGMVAAAGDRWSYYIPADQMQAFQENRNNAYAGIGISASQKEQGYYVEQVTAGGPAQEAGIVAGDLIVQVDDTRLADVPAEQWNGLIKGEEGSTVKIVLVRDGQELSFQLQRRTIKTEVATGVLLAEGVGYVKIKNFNDHSCEDTIAVIESLRSQGATSIVFDVRYNGGGAVSEMVSLLDYLLPEGVLYQSVDYRGKETVEKSDASFLDMPMAVIVNGSSYSAAEFFPAVLAEYQAAVIVGEKTSGKGYFQQTFYLSDGSAVAISTGKYFTPAGVHLEGVGITPEVLVPVDEQMAAAIYAGTLDPMEDPQIIAAINALKSAK